MSDKKVTVIISDLHVGGGPNDPGDDHVYQGSQFQNFIGMLATSSEGLAGEVELFINGDFLEFAQVRPDVYTLGSNKYWCSEAESVIKLEAILKGHPGIFAALKKFQGRGNLVTIAAGNHDVDFFWSDVQKRFSNVAGDVSYAVGDEWFTRYDGRLKIGHGHQYDPANRFENWWNPVLGGSDGVARLEMCPGTLFMVKFVNWLEKKYPFSDNIHPVTNLAKILWKEDRLSLVSVAWMLSRFATRHPKFALGVDEDKSKLATRIRQRLEFDDDYAREIAALKKLATGKKTTVDQVRQLLDSDDAVFDFLCELIPSLDPEEWMEIIDDAGQGAALGIGGEGKTLAILNPKTRNDKENLRNVAQSELEGGAGIEIVVMGHTHQPDKMNYGRGVYYNTGSWTRYAEIEQMEDLTMEDLKREEDFPYQLNYVRVQRNADDTLTSEMICFEEQA